MILATIILFVVCILLILYVTCKITCGYTKSKVCLLGKTAIVTGGNSGIGYQVALDLASRGCRVIIADKVDASQSRDRIIEETNNPNIVIRKLDLASFKSIRDFAKDINETEERIDILINDAGIGGDAPSFTEDGLQVTWQVNYYGPFLLTHLLIDILKRSAPSRIIFTSSLLGHFTLMKEKDMMSTKDSYRKSSPSGCYQHSKLCTSICALLFAAKLKGTGVTCNVLHPGMVYTSIYLTAYKSDRRFRIWFGYIMTCIYGKSPSEGAQTTIHLAVANEVKNVSGKLFMDCKPFYMPPQAYNREFCEKVWKISEELSGLKEHEQIHS